MEYSPVSLGKFVLENRDLKYLYNGIQIELDVIWVKSFNVSLAQYTVISPSGPFKCSYVVF